LRLYLLFGFREILDYSLLPPYLQHELGHVDMHLYRYQLGSWKSRRYVDPDGGKSLFNISHFYIANAAVNVASDGKIPMPITWKLQMRIFQKLLVCRIFLLGGFVIGASIIRTSSLTRLKHSHDISWVRGSMAMWSQNEISVAVICACLPTLQPIFRIWAMKLTSWRGWRQFDENSPIQQLPGKEDISRSGNTNIQPNGDEP
ncbi:hypothetical protein N7507_003141, partial [Penicillium longicatenatum]